MRVVFMGTPEFSAGILQSLSQAFEVVGVYTRPDAVRGRGKGLIASPVKQKAEELDLQVFTPKTLRNEEVQQELAALAPDVICVAAYGAILPKEVLELPKYGCINVHASLLPRWRGAAPIERAILAGDERAGVCIMRMEEGLDTGAYCSCVSTEVADKNAIRLTNELAELGAKALLSSLECIETGTAQWIEQDESLVTYAHKLDAAELHISPSDAVVELLRKIRAASDAHPCKCCIAGKGITVLRAQLVDSSLEVQQGRVLFQAKRLYVGCSDGAIEILEVKPDGKKAMDAKAYAAGLQGVKQGNVEWGGLHACK